MPSGSQIPAPVQPASLGLIVTRHLFGGCPAIFREGGQGPSDQRCRCNAKVDHRGLPALHHVAILPTYRRSSRFGERERPGLSVGVVHSVLNLSDFATLVTILAIAADAIDEVGPRGAELGLHGLCVVELRHDLESRWPYAPAIGTRSPQEPNKIAKTSCCPSSESSPATGRALALCVAARARHRGSHR